jgi:hypothetical protein
MAYMPNPTDAPLTVEMTWGQALHYFTGQSAVSGGLKRTHAAIVEVFGDVLGTRASFQHLFKVRHASDLRPKEIRRAWALLVASGLEPTDERWGLPAEDVIWPASTTDSAQLRTLLAVAVGEVRARSHPAGRDCSRMVAFAA